jgi:hypothetical protein
MFEALLCNLFCRSANGTVCRALFPEYNVQIRHGNDIVQIHLASHTLAFNSVTDMVSFHQNVPGVYRGFPYFL